MYYQARGWHQHLQLVIMLWAKIMLWFYCEPDCMTQAGNECAGLDGL